MAKQLKNNVCRFIECMILLMSGSVYNTFICDNIVDSLRKTSTKEVTVIIIN